MKKAAIFADVQNIYYTTRDTYGRSFNYREFMTRMNHEFLVTGATAYAIDRTDDGQRRFQQALRHTGFEVKLKPYIQRADGSAKGDWDVGITIDVLTMAPDVDAVVLLSGDGDFDLLIETVVDRYGIPCVVYGVAALTADKLKYGVANFVPIENDLLV